MAAGTRNPRRISAASCSRSRPSGVPVRVRDVGRVELGPDIRRGVCRLNGTGEAVTGIVVMRQGENALEVIERVKAKLHEIEPGLPRGREDGQRVRPLRADPAVHRQPEAYAHRGADHRRHRDHDFPMAFSERHHPGIHHSDRHRDRLHSHAADGADVEHHVARRDRHRGRRHGGRVDRGGGADAQEARRVGAHGPQGGLSTRGHRMR